MGMQRLEIFFGDTSGARFSWGKSVQSTRFNGRSVLVDVFERDVHCLLGLPFDAMDMAGTVSRIRDAAVRREPCFFSTPNLNFVVTSLSDEAFRDSIIGSDLSIADGMPIVWIARLLGVPITERVAGSGVFERLRSENRGPISVYFFGGPEGVAEAACNKLNSSTSGLVCVGYECPGFGSAEEMSSEETIARINASGADFIAVSLGARKGQAWIARNRSRLSAPVIGHLGAVLNFVAGTIRRAPTWVQRWGFEWLWRIKEERRLWSRYLVDGVVFLRLLVLRVIPHLWLIRQHVTAPSDLVVGNVERYDSDAGISISIRGAWASRNLKPLRECFSRASRDGKDIRLEMRHVTFVDSAFVGLLMLLYVELKRRGRRFSIGTIEENVRRVFHYSCAEFLLGTDIELGGDAHIPDDSLKWK